LQPSIAVLVPGSVICFCCRRFLRTRATRHD
jgi:hypothetical protein